jgi:holo-[acyl-carrier protein] synthase
MIENLGVGIDIVDVNRFRNMPYEEETSFYKGIFDKNEIDYCLKFSDPYPHFAGKFAIKEALIKSIDTKENLSKIITDHHNKKPIVRICEKNDYEFSVSISHEKNYAIGMVISKKIIA